MPIVPIVVVAISKSMSNEGSAMAAGAVMLAGPAGCIVAGCASGGAAALRAAAGGIFFNN